MNLFWQQVSFFMFISSGEGIVGGKKASIFQFPWQVGVEIAKKNGNSFCGGALINDEWVLTAAHCVYEMESATVIAGTTRIHHILELLHLSYFPSEIKIKVVDIVIHEDFKTDLSYDIALMKLSSRVYFNARIQPIMLDYDNLLAPEKCLLASGWGKTGNDDSLSTDLKFIKMTVISKEQCQISYWSEIQNSSFCTKSFKNADNICLGDSGGAGVLYDKKVPIHVGIISFLHSSGCESKRPVGFTKTAFFIDWIKRTAGL